MAEALTVCGCCRWAGCACAAGTLLLGMLPDKGHWVAEGAVKLIRGALEGPATTIGAGLCPVAESCKHTLSHGS